MINLKNRIVCDNCGKFISSDDVENGKAYHQLFTPDSYFSYEVYESYCKKCNNLENRQVKIIK